MTDKETLKEYNNLDINTKLLLSIDVSLDTNKNLIRLLILIEFIHLIILLK